MSIMWWKGINTITTGQNGIHSNLITQETLSSAKYRTLTMPAHEDMIFSLSPWEEKTFILLHNKWGFPLFSQGRKHIPHSSAENNLPFQHVRKMCSCFLQLRKGISLFPQVQRDHSPSHSLRIPRSDFLHVRWQGPSQHGWGQGIHPSITWYKRTFTLLWCEEPAFTQPS